jgi:hypothetical protein
MAGGDNVPRDRRGFVKVDRVTQDDLEVLKLILNSNHGLMVRVLDKIRQVRAMRNAGASKSAVPTAESEVDDPRTKTKKRK